jgi:hypothetical protein
VILFAGIATSLAGQEIPRTIASSSNWADTLDSRRAQAGDWLREISRIESQIPTSSPSEQAWLKVEYDDEMARNGATPRANRARYSKEGASRFAKPVAARMVAILDQLSSRSPLTEPREVALWSELAYLGLDTNFWGDVSTLGDLGVLSRNPQSKVGTGGLPGYQELLRGIWASRAQDILRSIVLPFVARAGAP